MVSRASTDGQAAEMVGVGMRHHGQCERSGALPLEEWRHDPTPRIRPAVRRPGIHEDPPAAGRADRGRVPLPDVQKM